MIFVKADFTDIEEISKLYDDVCDYLCTHENYPGWKKGVYPTKDDAESGIKVGTLYIAKENQKIVGTVILRYKPEAVYKNVAWASESNYEKIYVIYTLAEELCVKKSTISMYENDKVDIKGSILIELSGVLHTSPNYLLGMEEYEEDLLEIITVYKNLKGSKTKQIALEQMKLLATMSSEI